MDDRPARQRSITSFARVVRAFAEGALVAIGFALVMLLIGAPVALGIRYLHAGLSWLAASGGRVSAPVEALVSVASVAGGVIVAFVFVKLLVGVLAWRREVTQ